MMKKYQYAIEGAFVAGISDILTTVIRLIENNYWEGWFSFIMFLGFEVVLGGVVGWILGIILSKKNNAN